MQLNRLCFILPADLDEIQHPDHHHHHHHHQEVHKAEKSNNEKPQLKRDCGSQFLEFFNQLLSRLHDLRWVSFCNCNHGTSRNHSSEFHDLEGVPLSDKAWKDNPRIFSYAELYIGTNGFSADELLGSGGFGRVYRALLPSDGTTVAVKCLAEKGERFEKTFAAELMAVAHLRHRNLVRLRGWCVHEDQLLLVYDYMPNRSLDRILFKKADNKFDESLSWERRRKILSGLAAALHYLHDQLETQIIHRDVKSSNVMLDSNFNARLGDFGLARWLEHELEYQIQTPSMKNRMFRLGDTSRIGGTIGYLPPESFQKRSVATAKSDVFSFGIVVLEVVSGRRAVDLTFPDDQIVLLDWVRRLSDHGNHLLQAGDSRIRDGSYSLSDMERLIHLALICTLHNPQSRPTMKWVVEALSGNINGKLPPLPSFQAHPLYITISSTTTTNTSNSTTSRSIVTTSISGVSNSSNYVTAIGETIYATADHGHGNDSSSSSSNTSHRPFEFIKVDTPREISYKEIVSATNNFSESRRVAELDFGTAYHGFLDNHHHVLIKRLGMTQCPALQVRFSTELQNLGRLRHRNLVQLRGWCTEQGEMLVVYDYNANRLLSHLLFHHNRNNARNRMVLRWRHRYNIIKSLASAILYLHEEWDEQVIHRNITSSAVVLDPDMNPRLTSFALAEFLARNDHGHHAAATKKSSSVRGIFGYMSPEYMESGEANTMADIYSFGVVMLEMVSGQMAVDFRRPEVFLVRRVHDFEEQGRPWEELADFRLNGEYDREEVERLVKLGIACTSSNPGSRPSMRQIVSILDGHDDCFVDERKRESLEEWKQRNASSLSLIKSVQALGIQ